MAEDLDEQIQVKLKAMRYTRHALHVEEEAEECSVCLGVLCEPVLWPGCSHYYCFRCMLKMRKRLRPACPLCRTSASHVQESWALQVDQARAHLVRYTVGHSSYEALRRELWAEVAEMEMTTNLGTLPLMCAGWSEIAAGSSFVLPVWEPRYRAVANRAEAPGGSSRFVLITCPGNLESGVVFEAGSVGRLCEIVEVQQDVDGPWHVKVETGMACRVLEVTSEEIEVGALPLFHGLVEKLQEQEFSSYSAGHSTMDVLQRSRLIRRLLSRAGNVEQSEDHLANATIHSSWVQGGTSQDRRLQRAMDVISSTRSMQGADSNTGQPPVPSQITRNALRTSNAARGMLASERDDSQSGLPHVPAPASWRRLPSPSGLQRRQNALGSWRTAGRLAQLNIGRRAA